MATETTKNIKEEQKLSKLEENPFLKELLDESKAFAVEYFGEKAVEANPVLITNLAQMNLNLSLLEEEEEESLFED